MSDFIKEGFRKLKLHSPKMARCLSLYGIDLLTEPLRKRIAELEMKGKNCYQVPKGRGFCDNCGNEKPELCRYTNTTGALKTIAELQSQVDRTCKWESECEGSWDDTRTFSTECDAYEMVDRGYAYCPNCGGKVIKQALQEQKP